VYKIKFFSMCVVLMLLLSISAGIAVGQGQPPNSSMFIGTGTNDLWSSEEAAYYASLEIHFFAQSNAAGEFLTWQKATTGAVTLVRDTTGDPVLYDIAVESNGHPVGLIQIWAKKSMGVPFHTVSTSTVLLDLARRSAEAHKIVTQKLGDVKITETKMVYYDYPKRAFALTVQAGEATDRVLVDVTTRQIVSSNEIVPFATILNADNLQKSMQEWENLRGHLEDRNGKEIISKNLDVQTTLLYEKWLNVPLYSRFAII